MVTHEHAVEVDTKLSELWEQASKLTQQFDWAADKAHRAAGEKQERDRSTYRSLPWQTPLADTLATLRVIADPALIEAPWTNDSEQNRLKANALKAGEAIAEVQVARDAIEANNAAQRPLNREFSRERWSRFFLVQNTGGHIHKDMDCKTTFPTTRWAWLPSLSGLNEDAAVAEQGPRLCSICFPSAPVEWTLGLPAKVDPNRCPGSGQQGVDIDRRYYSPRGRCPVCGQGTGISSTGKVRPHKIPKGA